MRTLTLLLSAMVALCPSAISWAQQQELIVASQDGDSAKDVDGDVDQHTLILNATADDPMSDLSPSEGAGRDLNDSASFGMGLRGHESTNFLITAPDAMADGKVTPSYEPTHSSKTDTLTWAMLDDPPQANCPLCPNTVSDAWVPQWRQGNNHMDIDDPPQIECRPTCTPPPSIPTTPPKK
ncbi:MAG: hypothetical protein SGI99_17795 [Pseudomonadota bacterium]|nr:hypothetical protein [Pseudomonadota bacterium]